MLKFDNAYLCKSGYVGMAFMYGRNVCHVFHDGKVFKTSEDAPLKIQKKCLELYFKLRKNFKKLS